MKRVIAVVMVMALLCSAFAEVSKPSLDGRAKVADVGELPVGLFAKSASFLPGDTVIVTNPATKISIEVMIFGNIGSSEGIAIVLSPEAARELYITKGSNVIVKVTKKSDTYEESSILAKTLQTYTPEAVDESEMAETPEEPEFDTPSEAAEEDFYFYDDPDAVIEQEAAETAIAEESEAAEVIEVEPEPVEPVEEVAFEEPEWPAEVVEVEPEPVEPAEEVAFEEPEWPAEVVEVEPEPVEPAEEVAFEEPEWPVEEAEEVSEEIIAEEIIAEEVVEPEAEIVYVEAMDDQPVEEVIEDESVAEEEPVIEYVELVEELPEENENFIEETETVLIPAEPNPPTYEEIIQDEPEIVIIPIFEEEPEVASVIEEEPEVASVIEEEPEIIIVPEPVAEVVPEVVSTVEIPYGEIVPGKWYIQIATCSKLESVENIVSQYGKKYPLVVVKLASGDMRVLVGSLSADEYPTILARFKAFGFKDAFVRSR